ncbi:Helix-turn-helix domain-containing protein [Lysobacter sp. yr284]|uniref:ArsR/SmtB family transcription factor n=1 Tax=Lysobacter sp. yr284 TaxID=1761791 RepID=UPI000897ED4C|nr:helix-turn-helix domain-containing protein [Lysobacter sp. yr284]SDY42762.1 Helix-turn-helix domain-containing protein [Lysobacter sp. yr284]
MRPLHHPAVADIELTAVLYALADPMRLSLVRGLSRDKPVSCIRVSEEKALGLPRATLSRHFDVLRSAGLVHTVKSGTQYLNTLRCDDLEQRFPGLLRAILFAETDPAAAAGAAPRTAAGAARAASPGTPRPAATKRAAAAPRAGRTRP